MCKDNYADYWKDNYAAANLRNGRTKEPSFAFTTSIHQHICSRCALTQRPSSHIIKFTHKEHPHVRQENQLAQARRPPQARVLEPVSRAGYRFSISAERFFRCQRSSPGQIRDAAARPNRPPAGQSSSPQRSVFLVPPTIKPSWIFKTRACLD